MTAQIPELRRPLPSFEQWLNENGHTKRGDGFDDLVDLVERTLPQQADHLHPDVQSFVRLIKGFMVASVELCNIEYKHDRDPSQIVSMFSRAMGAAAFYATASICQEDTPWRSIAKVLTEEFKFGAKEAADQHVAGLDRK